MVAFLPVVYLTYMFLSLYMLFFFLIIFLKNIQTYHAYTPAKKDYSISVLIPAYNEESSIKETLEAVLKSDYPLKEIIVINDGSTDKTRKIVEEMAAKHSIIHLINKHIIHLPSKL